MTKIDEATEARLIQDYKDGVYYREILKKYRVSPDRLKKMLQKAGVYNSRRPDYSKVPKELITADYEAKIPLREICEKYSISRDALYDIVYEADAASPFRLTSEQEREIVIDYVAGKPLNDIAAAQNMGIGVVERVLTQNDVERDRRIGASLIDIEASEQMYREGLSFEAIGAFYGADRRAVKNRFVQEGVELKTISEYHQFYSFNEHYFDDPNKPDVAYFLGFLWADGCNKTYASCMQMTLQTIDLDALVKLKTALESTHPIYHYERPLPSGVMGRYSDFQITNQKLSATLEELGMVRAKTYAKNMGLPNGLNHEMTRHFLRGLIDGDGWISESKVGAFNIEAGVLAHIDVLNILQPYIEAEAGVSSTIHEVKLVNPDICHTKKLNIGGNRNVVKFLQWLYKDSSVVRLDRKYETYKRVVTRYFAEIKGAHKIGDLNFIHP